MRLPLAMFVLELERASELIHEGAWQYAYGDGMREEYLAGCSVHWMPEVARHAESLERRSRSIRVELPPAIVCQNFE